MSELLVLPVTQDISFQRGDDLPLVVTVSDLDGLPVDLTGVLLAADVRETASAPMLLASFTITVTDPVGGVLSMLLPATTTAGLPTHSVWDLQSTWLDGSVLTLQSGRLHAQGDVTR